MAISRLVATLGGALVLAVVAAGLTEATLAYGQRGSLSNDADSRPVAGVATPRATAKPSATPKPTATPTPSPSASPTPSATPAPTATTNDFVHLRADESTSSNILANLNGGTVVELLPESNDQWQEVEWNGITGFIFKAYLAY